MLSIQHVLCAKLFQPDLSSADIAAVVYPDAIRAYIGARQYSHFEMNENNDGYSYCQFPSSMKMEKDDVIKLFNKKGHLESARPCVLGENTNIEAFYDNNSHLPENIFRGIERHLKQDIEFDNFVRNVIDCSKKYEDKFIFKGKELDGKEVRSFISKMEQYGIYVLASKLYEEQGITVNQKWLEDVVKPALEKEYPTDLAEKTFSFMNIDEEINKLITNHDWSKISNGPISQSIYNSLYNDVLDAMEEEFERD